MLVGLFRYGLVVIEDFFLCLFGPFLLNFICGLEPKDVAVQEVHNWYTSGILLVKADD